jgi:alkanesulfonate monooxygenase SsuD/methylene tetrahydromethanopterin reductase-like flavin-dependent oxidoreductase (luciferase family)
MKRELSTTVLFFIAFSITMTAYARDAARDLRRMVGFTIVVADTVDEVSEKSGEKRIKLSNGLVFKVEFLLLDPLTLTDVIVFAKPLPKELVTRYQGKLPDRLLYSYKLLIDNEIFDATPQ